MANLHGVTELYNHWQRPLSPRTYYWFLTFQHDSKLQALVEQCQRTISFPYYDLVVPSSLHLTLERVAYEHEISDIQLAAIGTSAMKCGSDIEPFAITINDLGGTAGAIGLNVSSVSLIRSIRDKLRDATLSIYPGARIRHDGLNPHISIAYCNTSGILAREAVNAVSSASPLFPLSTTIDRASLVLLERRARSYDWRTILDVPFSAA